MPGIHPFDSLKLDALLRIKEYAECSCFKGMNVNTVPDHTKVVYPHVSRKYFLLNSNMWLTFFFFSLFSILLAITTSYF